MGIKTQEKGDLEEIFENQRWLGVSWGAPLGTLDHPAWSRRDGSAVRMDDVMLLCDSEGSVKKVYEKTIHALVDRLYTIVVDASTDAEGWQYGTVFKHLEYKRAGGRASRRFGDTVRRRRWVRKEESSFAQSSARHRQADVAFQTKHANDSASRALRTFLKLLVDAVSKKKFWDLIPWDPGAYYVLQQKHKDEYSELLNHAKENSLVWDTMPPLLHDHGTLLQNLLCGAIHSRAAYGFAMQAGHIKDISSYIRLHTLQPLRFDAVGGVSQEANNEAISELTGIPLEHIVQSNWRNSPFRPCYYVAADTANHCIVISIRGSLELGDLLSDVTANSLHVNLVGVDGWVHEGMMASATYIHCCTKAALRELGAQHPGWPVLVTGHSLGGGVAGVLTLLLRDAGGIPGLGDVYCITIGSAAVMSEHIATACDEFAISLVLGADCIPHLSHASLEKLLLELSSASPVKTLADDVSKTVSEFIKSALGTLDDEQPAVVEETSSCPNSKTVPVIDLNSSSSDTPENRQNRKIVLNSENDTPEMMYPPGKIIWILSEQAIESTSNARTVYDKESVADLLDQGWTTGIPSNTKANPNDSVRIAMHIDRDLFERILLLPSMLDDHVPDKYLDVLQEL
ncbi:hypothetical protein M9435_002896 [Picochlorum sp. BPE23]|nr:hypothetical protein M9435_002896 [Picochlorum sp. BPE23]